MAQNSFKIGDVVRLKSDGPRMTVAGFDIALDGSEIKSRVRCQWFKNDELKFGTFNADALEIDDSDD